MPGASPGRHTLCPGSRCRSLGPAAAWGHRHFAAIRRRHRNHHDHRRYRLIYVRRPPPWPVQSGCLARRVQPHRARRARRVAGRTARRSATRPGGGSTGRHGDRPGSRESPRHAGGEPAGHRHPLGDGHRHAAQQPVRRCTAADAECGARSRRPDRGGRRARRSRRAVRERQQCEQSDCRRRGPDAPPARRRDDAGVRGWGAGRVRACDRWRDVGEHPLGIRPVPDDARQLLSAPVLHRPGCRRHRVLGPEHGHERSADQGSRHLPAGAQLQVRPQLVYDTRGGRSQPVQRSAVVDAGGCAADPVAALESLRRRGPPPDQITPTSPPSRRPKRHRPCMPADGTPACRMRSSCQERSSN